MKSFIRLLPFGGRITRGLRFRLTLTYVVLFAFLLAFVGLLFRQTLKTILHQQVAEILNEEWAAVRGYLRIEKGRANWYYDRDDPEEAFIIDRLHRTFLLTDAEGRVLEVSRNYRGIGIDSPETIRALIQSPSTTWSIRTNEAGVAYMVRTAILFDERREAYFVALGRSLTDSERVLDDFTWKFCILLPIMISASSLLGWFMAGRALRPVTDVAQAAQHITGSNLKLHIPTRGAGDELDHLIDTFNRMVERLNSSFQQIRQFSTDVSHELRTPLTVVRGQLEVALLTAESPEQYREAMLTALEEVERLTQIVRVLLLLSQAESGQLALQKVQIDIAKLVSSIVEQFEIPAESAGVSLVAELPAECRMEGDKIQLERLVANLLSNAVKYTQQGGTVWVRVRRDGDAVKIEVEDNGQGIPAADLPYIFDRFYRVPSADPDKGLGLGLSFVEWIAKVHGGRIEVDSTVGRGTMFTVSLPAPRMAPVPEADALRAEKG